MTATQTAVTADQIITEVRRIAAENPDFRYRDHLNGGEKCFYNETEDGEPACIMGQALANLGHAVDPVYEQKGVEHVLIHQFGLHPGYQQGMWLTEVQISQDRGATWAEAVETADQRFGHV
jgi:hypothetical protein